MKNIVFFSSALRRSWLSFSTPGLRIYAKIRGNMKIMNLQFGRFGRRLSAWALVAFAAFAAQAFDGAAAVAGARARFEAWKGADETLVFPLVNDLHPDHVRAAGDPRDPRTHLETAFGAARAFGADFLAVLGDLGLRTGAWGYGRHLGEAHEVLDGYLAQFAGSPVPTVFAMGNDDYIYTNPRKDRLAIGPKDVAAKLNASLADATFLDADLRDSGYWDFPAKKCRVLFLNSSAGRTGLVPYGLTTNLFAFATRALETVPAGYAVIVLSHKSFCDEFKWILSTPPPRSYTGDDEMMRLLGAFRHGASGEEMGVKFDFAPAKARGATLVGCISGDAHVDFEYYWLDVNWIASQSLAPHIALLAGDGSPKWGHRAEHQFFDFAEDTLIDVVAVKPAKGQMRLFRIGHGGAGRDRLFVFGENRDPGFLPGEDAPPAVEPYRTAIPDWARAKIAETKARFTRWKGADEVFAFPIFTDNHSGVAELPRVPSWRDTKMHSLIVQEAARAFGCDFLADFGDIGMDRNNHFAFEGFGTRFGMRRNAAQLRLYADWTMPVLFVTGNHDVFVRLEDRPYAPLCAYGRYFNAAAEKRGMRLVTGPNRDYGHWDVAAKKVRVIYANTSEGNSYGITGSQVAFLAESFRTTPAGWTAILLSHLPINACVGLTPERYAKAKWRAGQRELKEVVDDFAAKSPNGCRFAGAFAGDYHQQIFRKDGKTAWYVSQSLGPGTEATRDDPTKPSCFWRIDPGTETLVDVVGIKPATGEVRVFRIGAGGERAEKEWRF